MTTNETKTELALGCISFFGTFFLQAFILFVFWNLVMPGLLGVQEISFWQACGIKIMIGAVPFTMDFTGRKKTAEKK